MRTLLLASAVTLLAAPALAQSFTLEVDEAAPIRLPAPVTGVVIGNAGVADVIVHDANLLFVLGKSVGQTQLVAVDARGHTIFSGRVEVRAAEQAGLVTVQRGTELSTVQCTARCIGVVHPEASANGMQGAIGAITARNGFTRGSGGN